MAATVWPKNPVDVAANKGNYATTVTRVTYAIATQEPAGRPNEFSEFIGSPTPPVTDAEFSSTIVTDIAKAMLAWSAVANIKFIQAPQASADVVFGFGKLATPGYTDTFGLTTDLASGAMLTKAYVHLEDQHQLPIDRLTASDPYAQGQGGDLIYHNTTATILSTLEHEIGHALGLPDNTTDKNSIMYINSTNLNTKIDNNDVKAIQALYGPPTTPVPTITLNPPPDDGRMFGAWS